MISSPDTHTLLWGAQSFALVNDLVLGFSSYKLDQSDAGFHTQGASLVEAFEDWDEHGGGVNVFRRVPSLWSFFKSLNEEF